MKRSMACFLILSCYVFITGCPHGLKENTQNELIISSFEQGQFVGELKTNKTGVKFESRGTGKTSVLRLMALSGRNLILAEQDPKRVNVQILDNRFEITFDKSEINNNFPLLRKGLANEKTRPDSLELVRSFLFNSIRMSGDSTALGDLLNSAEFSLMPTLSFELGKLRLFGNKYPPSLPIHTMGLSAAGLLEVNPGGAREAFAVKLPDDMTKPDMLSLMYEFHPPLCFDPADGISNPNVDGLPPCLGKGGNNNPPCTPKENDCLGLCGPGCTCWDWVCGDCCFHGFCAAHDKLLRDCNKSKDPANCIASYLGFPLFVVACRLSNDPADILTAIIKIIF